MRFFSGECYQYDQQKKRTSVAFTLRDSAVSKINYDNFPGLTTMGMALIAASDKQVVFGVPLARTNGMNENFGRQPNPPTRCLTKTR